MTLAEAVAGKLIPDGDANSCWQSLNAGAPYSLRMADKTRSCKQLNYYETMFYTIYLIFIITRKWSPGQAKLLTSSLYEWIVREHRPGPARSIESMSTYTHTYLLFICFSFALPCQTATAGDKIVSPESINGTTIVDAEGLIELATQQPQLVMIDSRVTADRKEGFIEGSISLPDTDTRCKSLAQAVPALNSPLLFYCNGVKCGRSSRAAMIAVACGYSNIYWYRNGMEEWQKKEFPLVQ